MKRSTYFKKLVKMNRKALRKAKVPASTIHAWENGYRFPRLKRASEIAEILNVPVDSIPYYGRVE